MPVTDLPALWVNAHRFGAQVLRAGDEPWAVPEQLGLFYKELQGWLKLDVVMVDVQAAIDQWLLQQSQVPQSSDDVVDVLDDGRLHDHISEGLAAVLGCGIGQPVVPLLPGAGTLLQGIETGQEADEDMLDDVAVALTGMLREIYTPGLGALLVNECNAQALAFYAPLVNVAQNYESPLLLAFSGPLDASPAGFSVVFDAGGENGGIYCRDLAPPADHPGTQAFIYTSIPGELSADAALARLAQLRH